MKREKIRMPRTGVTATLTRLGVWSRQPVSDQYRRAILHVQVVREVVRWGSGRRQGKGKALGEEVAGGGHRAVLLLV